MNSKELPSVTEVATTVAKKLEAISQKAFVPTISRTRIAQQEKNHRDKHRNLLKFYKTRQNNVKYKARIAKFQHEAESLFDILCLQTQRRSNLQVPEGAESSQR